MPLSDFVTAQINMVDLISHLASLISSISIIPSGKHIEETTLLLLAVSVSLLCRAGMLGSSAFPAVDNMKSKSNMMSKAAPSASSSSSSTQHKQKEHAALIISKRTTQSLQHHSAALFVAARSSSSSSSSLCPTTHSTPSSPAHLYTISTLSSSCSASSSCSPSPSVLRSLPLLLLG